ncbi:MAG: hypothetical protein NEHIOOID_01358 [Holosporales bacterium]
MILLLGVAIAFCWQLNGKLTSLKDIHLKVLPALKSIHEYVTQFSQNLDVFKVQMKQTKDLLGTQAPKVKAMKEDIELILEYSESAIKRLETLVEESRIAKKELDETLQIVQKTYPKNFKDILDNADLSVDFDALKRQEIKNLTTINGHVILPQKVTQKQSVQEFNIDQSILAQLENIR